MIEEDLCNDLPAEPHVILPKESLIHMELHSPKCRKNPFKNVNIINILNSGKFPVYLAKNEEGSQEFAMKLFESQDERSQKCFKNEIRFRNMSHPNIIKLLHFEEEKAINSSEITTKGSIILFELAPYGDFLSFILNYHQHFSEKLIRTYFKQLIQGLEYLHGSKIAHLDIKLENLLMGENFQLKIADFDLSCFTNETRIRVQGTKYYRAPEMMKGKCINGPAADIYSAGVILFVLMSGGRTPHMEDALYHEIDFLYLLNHNNSEFWKKHVELGSKYAFGFSHDFKTLFNGLTKLNPEERFQIREIKNSKWYNGESFTNEELKTFVQSFARA